MGMFVCMFGDCREGRYVLSVYGQYQLKQSVEQISRCLQHSL